MPYEITYRDITEGNNSNPITIRSETASIDIQPVIDGHSYEISVVAINSIGVRSAPRVLPVYTVVGKTLPPADVTGLTAIPNKYGNYVSWDVNTDIDLQEYEVRKGTSWAAGTIVKQGSTSTSFTDTEVLSGIVTYWCKAKDTTGNYSTTAVSAVVSNLPPNTVTGFTATQNKYNNYLSWNANIDTDLQGYELRKGSSWSNSTLVASGLTTTNYTDTEITSGVTNYWCKAIDSAGAYSDIVANATITNALPTNITGFTLTQNKYNNYLSWNANTNFDLQEYEIRKGTSWDTGTLVTKGSTSTSFTDTAISSGTTTYWCKAKDTAGAYSLTPATISINNAVPSDITGFTTTQNKYNNYLSWNVNTDIDLQEYEIRKGTSWEVGAVVSKGSTSTSFTDNAITSGSTTYWCKAKDTAGAYSAFAAQSYINNLAPTDITGLNITITKLGYKISWNANTDIGFQEYELRRGTSWDVGTLVTKGTTTNFLDTNVSIGITQYWCKAIDTVGSTSVNAAYAQIDNAIPSDVTGLAVTTTKYGKQISWNANTDIDLQEYEVRKGTSWDIGIVIQKGSTSTSFTDTEIASGNFTYWCKAKDTAGSYSATAATITIPANIPTAPVLSYILNSTDYRISWVAPDSAYGIDRYEIKTGTSWETGTLVGSTKSSIFQNPVTWGGTTIFHIAAIDVAGNIGLSGPVSINIPIPIKSNLTNQVVDNNVLLYWTDATNILGLPITSYEIRKGSTYVDSEFIGYKSGLFTTLFETVSGTYTYWVTGIDSAGNYGVPASVYTSVSQPPDYILTSEYNSYFTGGIKNTLSPTDKSAEIIINGTQVSRTLATPTEYASRSITGISSSSVIKRLYWEVEILNGGTYPNTIMIGVGTSTVPLTYTFNNVGAYLYYGLIGDKYINGTPTAYGASFTTGDTIGIALDMVAGTLTMFKNDISQGVMVSGLTGTLYPIISLYNGTELVDVNYGHKAFKYPSNVSFISPNGFNEASLSNALVYQNTLSLPHNLTETWQSHFSSRAWNTPTDQVNAGYPVYAEPTASAGYYEEIIDYGTILAANKITTLLDIASTIGTPGTVVTISISATGPHDAVPTTYAWTNYVGMTSIYATTFRYIKIKVAVTSSTGQDLLSIRNIFTKLDAKLINEAGSGQCVAGDSGGSLFNFTVPFVDVHSIVATIMTPPSTTARYVVVDFTDTPNPTGFKALLYDAAGNRATGNISWAAKGN